MIVGRAPTSLTADQAAAVEDDSARILVVAPAGSGKTEVIARRVIRLLEESRGEGHRILAVTYTVKAAESLRARIATSVADEAWRVDSDTIHGFALDWLRRYGEVVGVSQNVVVYADDLDRAAVIEGYLRSLSPGATLDVAHARKLLRLFDAHRTDHPDEPDLESPEAMHGMPVGELYAGYVAALTEDQGIDFPGMLAKLGEALELDEWIPRHFRSIYRHVLIDEGQDLTVAQVELIDRLTGDDLALFVVADDRQAINGYAGGAFVNAQRLLERRGAPVTLQLRDNFRCSSRIVEAAERVAQHLAKAPPSAQAAGGAPPGIVQVRACTCPAAEAREVVDWAERLLACGLEPSTVAEGEDVTVYPESIAIVGRTRWTLDAVVAELERRGHLVVLQADATDLLRTPEGRLALDSLALEANPADKPARRRAADELAAYHEGALDEFVAQGDIAVAMSVTELDALRPIWTAVERIRADDDLDGAFEALLKPVEPWSEDADRIGTMWRTYRSETPIVDRKLSGFLRFFARIQRSRPTDPGIRVMTIDRVKGLEFRAVAIVGAREGMLPDYRAATTSELDAERRRFYVAMTRAERDLLIVWPRTTEDRYGHPHHQQVSRFIGEAGLA